jgi:hypothetical protein
VYLEDILSMHDTSEEFSANYDAALQALTRLCDETNTYERENLQTAAITFALLHVAHAMYSTAAEIANK